MTPSPISRDSRVLSFGRKSASGCAPPGATAFDRRRRWMIRRSAIIPDGSMDNSWSSRQDVLANLSNNREVGVDDVGDLVFRGLPHEGRRAALREAVIRREPPVQLGRRVLKRFEQRP